MKITESEKNRIRGLHRNASVIKEDWGSKKDEYKRTDGKRSGDEGGHYKAYMNTEGETEFNEFWGGNKDEYKRRDGHRLGDEDGHYKTYMTDADDVIGVDRPESEKAQAKFNEDSEGEETYHYGEDEGEDHDEEMDLEHDKDMAPHDRVDAIQKHLDALKKDMSYDEDHEDRDEEGDDFE